MLLGLGLGVWQEAYLFIYSFVRLCRATWGWVSAYDRKDEPGFSFMELFMQLDEGTLTFNGDADLVSY